MLQGHASRFSPESVYNILWTFSNMPVPAVLALSVWGLSVMLLIGRWRLSHELRIQLRLYGATRYSDLPACEILAQDTLLWLDMEVCFSDPPNLLGDLLLEDFIPIAIQRLEKATLTTYRRRTNPPPQLKCFW